MKKKLLLAGALCLALGAGTLTARADDGTGSDGDSRFLGCGPHTTSTPCVMGIHTVIHQFTLFWVIQVGDSSTTIEPC